MSVFKEYLYRLFSNWFFRVSTALDMLGLIVLVVDIANPNYLFPRWVYLSYLLTVTFVGFIAANAKLFAESERAKHQLQSRIAELEAVAADIRLEVVQACFNRSYGNRPEAFRGMSRNPRGFDQQGLPDFGSLWAEIRLKNVGYETGKLIWKLEKSKTKLPTLFDSEKTEITFNLPLRIEGRHETSTDFIFDVLFTERDPHAFAETLKCLVKSRERYRIVISYKTERIDSESEARELSIEGDFQYLYESVVEHWEGSRFAELAQLAKLPSQAE